MPFGHLFSHIGTSLPHKLKTSTHLTPALGPYCVLPPCLAHKKNCSLHLMATTAALPLTPTKCYGAQPAMYQHSSACLPVWNLKPMVSISVHLSPQQSLATNSSAISAIAMQFLTSQSKALAAKSQALKLMELSAKNLISPQQ